MVQGHRSRLPIRVSIFDQAQGRSRGGRRVDMALGLNSQDLIVDVAEADVFVSVPKGSRAFPKGYDD